MAQTPEPDQTGTFTKRRLRERAGDFAREHVKYLIYVALVVGGMAATFYTSQAAQNEDRGWIKERVSCAETEVGVMKQVQVETKQEIRKQREDIAKTREEMVKVAQHQEQMATEQKVLSAGQRSLDGKMNDLKIILIRMEKNGNP